MSLSSFKQSRNKSQLICDVVTGPLYSARDRKLRINYENCPNLCAYCDTQIPYLGRHKKFCNSHCSATYNNLQRGPKSLESKTKTSYTIQTKLHGSVISEYKPKGPKKSRQFIRASGPYTKVKWKACSVCHSIGWLKHGRPICSDACYLESKRRCARGNKRIIYKNERFDSNWELLVAKHLDSKSIKWVKPRNALIWKDHNGKPHRYFPDFYLSDYDLYLDPKNGYVEQIQHIKLSYIREHYPNVMWGKLDDIIQIINAL